ncbi:MAG TPA: bifunctional adenosylcobinamide kinase/adenosylcobinamide-phosphate guanylyltransferase [Intrasporangium sp.]|uniref:bifunctional adenosylcobinamide kinase/adenosylcobinamide-phosphate guanylyltransferase n=1 Tax=Intrasporangium sp. TaxID=1925024 RepID=UPI002B461F8A|nr:bifunctional adenosylcobinamide kinase/adenosylcobinamide-phosphate guanylyltransferase [Intrasporangium sp.]HKX66621.1 bifunctional adenosylcobinamide kinase/adenosylcobinamide-phosphate guanylyltransferase [Intrasporangium sp.]
MTPRAPTTTLVTGPVRSGKSRHAEHLVALQRNVLYVATGRPAEDDDPAWAARVRAHQERRPSSWRTLETADAQEALTAAVGPVIIDCLGTWLTAQVDLVGWDDLDHATDQVRQRTASLIESLCRARHPVVVVTNEVGWSLVPVTASGRFFQDELGRLNAAVAEVAAAVHLVVAGRVLDLTQAPLVPRSLPPRTLNA